MTIKKFKSSNFISEEKHGGSKHFVSIFLTKGFITAEFSMYYGKHIKKNIMPVPFESYESFISHLISKGFKEIK